MSDARKVCPKCKVPLEMFTSDLDWCPRCHRQFLGASAADKDLVIIQLRKELAVAEKKAAHSLANNLCPDHRDKQRDKSCLACGIERLTRLAAVVSSDLTAMTRERDMARTSIDAATRDLTARLDQLQRDYQSAASKRISAEVDLAEANARLAAAEELAEVVRRSSGALYSRGHRNILEALAAFDAGKMQTPTGGE